MFTGTLEVGVKIVAVGECTIDHHLDRGVDTVGGISLNFAVNCRRAGASDVALVGGVGNDPAARLIRAKLAREGVDDSRLHGLAGATPTQAIRLGPGGERIFPPGGYDPGVLTGFRLSADDGGVIASADLLAVPYFHQLEPLFWPAMDAAGPAAIRVVDLLDGADLGPGFAGIEPILGQADVVFLSADPVAISPLLEYSRVTRTVIVVTHGAAGSSALVAGTRFGAAAVVVPRAELVDTTGCGDAFQAGFAIEYLENGDVAGALAAGAIRAAEVIRYVGATGA